jgi:hypothetical protein
MFSLTRQDTMPIADIFDTTTYDIPTHLTYTTEYAQYHAMIITPKYFSAAGYIDYLRDNLKNIKFINGRATYAFVDLIIEKYIDIPDLVKRNKELIRHVDNIAVEMKLLKSTCEMFDGVPFSGTVPTWSTYTEFQALPDYKYINEVLENKTRILTNFQWSNTTGYIRIPGSEDFESHRIQIADRLFGNILGEPIGIPFNANTTPWLGYFNYKLSRYATAQYAQLVITGKNNILSSDKGFTPIMYVIAVLGGWMHLNFCKIQHKQYVIFINKGVSHCTFKLCTLPGKTAPGLFLYDWRRFCIINERKF